MVGLGSCESWLALIRGSGEACGAHPGRSRSPPMGGSSPPAMTTAPNRALGRVLSHPLRRRGDLEDTSTGTLLASHSGVKDQVPEAAQSLNRTL